MLNGRAVILFVCAILAAQLVLLTPSYAERRVALVIGNSRYQHTPALANPVNDATDVAKALTAIGFDVTLKLDVEKRQMDQGFTVTLYYFPNFRPILQADTGH